MPSLLTRASANPKTAKGADLPYEASILHLSPADLSGAGNVCAFASPGCKAACLNTAGHGGIGGPDNSVQRARARKTREFFANRPAFVAQLVREIENQERRAARAGKTAVVRLNGTSDLGWLKIPCVRDGLTYVNLFAAFPNVLFYDYTKVPSRFRVSLPDNYRLTFSLSETNDSHATDALAAGMNVAVVLNLADSDPMPETWSGRPVVDGTLHDFRFLDPQGGYIVGLRPKGKAKHDGSGFVRNVDACIDPARALVLAVAA